MSEVIIWLNKILSGCGVETEKQEAAGIIQSVIEAYSSGKISENELTGIVLDICVAISSISSKCSNYDKDTCVKELTQLIKQNIDVSSVAKKIGEILKTKKEKAGVSLI